jgi:hypothetical protein
MCPESVVPVNGIMPTWIANRKIGGEGAEWVRGVTGYFTHRGHAAWNTNFLEKLLFG